MRNPELSRLPVVLAAAIVGTAALAPLFAEGQVADGAEITLQRAQLATARAAASAAYIPELNVVYIFGGLDGTDANAPLYYFEIVEYEPVFGTVVRQGTDLPSPRAFTSAVWSGSHAYIFGGLDNFGAYLLDVLQYDPFSGTIGTSSTQLPTGLAGMSAVWTGTYALLFGGYDGTSVVGDILYYEPSSGTLYAVAANLPSGRLGTSAFWDGQYAYVIGGCLDFDCTIFSDEILQYDPATNEVVRMFSTLPDPLGATSVFWDGEYAYIVGGYDGTSANYPEVHRFDPLLDDMDPYIAAVPEGAGSYWAASAWTGTEGYLFGGINGCPPATYCRSVTSFVPTLALTQNEPPKAIFTKTESGLKVDVDGSGSSDPDGKIVRYEWDWGDGSSATVSFSPRSSHSYAKAGSYTVTLLVTDDQDATAKTFLLVKATDPGSGGGGGPSITSKVTGTIRDAAGLTVSSAPVLLFKPSTRGHWSLDQVVQADNQGNFNLPSVPSGDYLVGTIGENKLFHEKFTFNDASELANFRVPQSLEGRVSQTDLQQLKDRLKSAEVIEAGPLNPASPTTLTVNDATLPIRELGITSGTSVTGANVAIASFENKPHDQLPDPSGSCGKVYRYMAVGMADAQNNAISAQSVNMGFEVANDWLSGNGLKPQDVQMCVFDEKTKAWKSVRASYDESKKRFFSSVGDGASGGIYAIAGRPVNALLSALESNLPLLIVVGAAVGASGVLALKRDKLTRALGGGARPRRAPRPPPEAQPVAATTDARGVTTEAIAPEPMPLSPEPAAAAAPIPAAMAMRTAPEQLASREVIASGLTVQKGDKKVVDDVSFTIEHGQILAILGPSGGGKSTILKAIVGELPFSGEVSVFGADANKQRDAVKRLIGYVPQDIQLYPNMSVRENIEYFGAQYGRSRSELKQEAVELSNMLGMDEKIDEVIGNLSGGQQRRASIACALVSRPRLLVLDEPTSGLDPTTRRQLWRFLRQLKSKAGVAMIVTTHFIDEAEYADTVVILEAGKLVSSDSPENLKKALPGRGKAVEIELFDISEATMEKVRAVEAKAKGTGGIAQADYSGYAVRFYCEQPQTASSQLIQLLNESGVPFSKINVVDVTMEDVFVFHTGKRFPAAE